MSGTVTRERGESLESPAIAPSESAMSAGGRFRPGQSGNLRGRPRKLVKDQSAIERALDEVVTSKTKKGTKKISASEGIAKRLVQKALSGDISAVKMLKAEAPNFLTVVLKVESGDDEIPNVMEYISNVMSVDALREFSNAVTSWHKLRLLKKRVK